MTLKRALSILNKSSIHDYDSYQETADGERVQMLGIWEEEIDLLKRLVPSVQVEKVREGTEDFWRIHAWVTC